MINLHTQILTFNFFVQTVNHKTQTFQQKMIETKFKSCSFSPKFKIKNMYMFYFINKLKK